MIDLNDLVANARALVASGYYTNVGRGTRGPGLLKTFRRRGPHVVAEVKFRSPVDGRLADPASLDGVLSAYRRGGAHALSVLTEPRFFAGSLDHLRRATRLGLPVLMKDIILDPQQVRGGAVAGSSAVLLIQRVFDRGFAKMDVEDMIRVAHGEGVEVVLEVNTPEEYSEALDSTADIIGINNRNLDTMEVNLDTTVKILASREPDRPVMAMSGIRSRADLLRLHKAGADGFLVGTGLLVGGDPLARLRELLGGGHG